MRPSAPSKHISQKAEGTRGGETKAKNPPQAPSPQWKGDNIYLPKSAFEALKKTLGPEGAHIRFRPLERKYVEAKRRAGVERIITPPDYGTLQIAVNLENSSFLWAALKEVVDSKERAFLGFPYKGQVKLEGHVTLDQKIKSAPIDDILRNTGQTFLSKDLQRKVYGGLIAPGKKLDLTSPYENLTLIYFMSKTATETTVVHELLGHFYLATKGAPVEHHESLKGKGILDATGQPFEKNVLEFIETQVEAEAKKNLKAK